MTEASKPKPASKAAPTRKSAPKLTKMRREDGKTADVHPDEVQNYRQGGYSEE